jgi:poly(3-hydroxybutyrate) depolymerase
MHLRMRQWMFVVAGSASLGAAAPCMADAQVRLKTAGAHPMQYYLSLPRGWTPARKWPVLMVFEGADRQFEKFGDTYVRARANEPFIIVAPLILSNRGAASPRDKEYQYPKAAWDRIAADGACKFDLDGVAAISAELQRDFGAQSRFYFASLESGAHIEWAWLFRYPETVRAAAFVTPNYIGRCMDDAAFSKSSAMRTVPVQILHGARDTVWQHLSPQAFTAKRLGEAHGMRGIVERAIAGRGYGPLADEVVQWFADVRIPRQTR